MNRLIALLAVLATPAAASAQVVPTPSGDDPRLQTVTYSAGEPVRLIAFPRANLALLFQPGERVQQVVLSDPGAFRVSVVGTNDGIDIEALRPDARAGMTVMTGGRRYMFTLETGEGLSAANVVRFVNDASEAAASVEPVAPENMIGEYKVFGDSQLRPARITDDGERTYIEWGKYQSLPAVFGVGPSDQEEVVDGYMRGGVFTIDRVYRELVFRIDRESAKARRKTELGETRG